MKRSSWLMMKRVILVLLPLAITLPAFAQQRTLQDIARELKEKKDRKPGTLSAMESTIPRDSDATWAQVEISNAAYLDSLLKLRLADLALQREAPAIPQTVSACGYYPTGGYVQPQQQRRPVSVAGPAKQPRSPIQPVSRPTALHASFSSSGRSGRDGRIY